LLLHDNPLPEFPPEKHSGKTNAGSHNEHRESATQIQKLCSKLVRHPHWGFIVNSHLKVESKSPCLIPPDYHKELALVAFWLALSDLRPRTHYKNQFPLRALDTCGGQTRPNARITVPAPDADLRGTTGKNTK
jgi:hypothetical protein